MLRGADASQRLGEFTAVGALTTPTALAAAVVALWVVLQPMSRTPEDGPTPMTRNLPEIVSREEWLAARIDLLAREKALTRARDELNAARRRLPMVRVEEPYVFEGPDGPVTLLEMFEGRRQLLVHHFMWNYDVDINTDEIGRASCRERV